MPEQVERRIDGERDAAARHDGSVLDHGRREPACLRGDLLERRERGDGLRADGRAPRRGGTAVQHAGRREDQRARADGRHMPGRRAAQVREHRCRLHLRAPAGASAHDETVARRRVGEGRLRGDFEAAREHDRAPVLGDRHALHPRQDAPRHRQDADGATDIDGFDAVIDDDAEQGSCGAISHAGPPERRAHHLRSAVRLQGASTGDRAIRRAGAPQLCNPTERRLRLVRIGVGLRRS